MVTDEGGNILEEIEFNAYGEKIGENGEVLYLGGSRTALRTSISEVNSNNLSGLENLFVGAYGIKYDGKTNLHYMRYRWYSNDQMRFISPDLLLDINRYAYCNNNPINFVDILGLVSKRNLIILYYDELKEGKNEKGEIFYYRQPVFNLGTAYIWGFRVDMPGLSPKYKRLTRENLENSLMSGDTVLIATHGSTDLLVNPEIYQDLSKSYPFRGIIAHKTDKLNLDPKNDADVLISPQELCRIIRDLKKAGKLSTKYLVVDACASGNLPPSCKNIGKDLIYIGNRLPIDSGTYRFIVGLSLLQPDQIKDVLSHQKMLGVFISEGKRIDYGPENFFMVYDNSGATAVRPANSNFIPGLQEQFFTNSP